MRRTLWALLLSVWAACTFAHKPSDSYLSLGIDGEVFQGQWDIALRDLDYAIGLDGNDDGILTWGELRRSYPVLSAYALSHLRISAGRTECLAEPKELLVDEHSDGQYAVLRFSARCGAAPKALDIDYSLFFDLDPQHRGLFRLQSKDRTNSGMFSPAANRFHWVIAEPSDPWREFFNFGREGVWHIWIGFDHVLFLLTLLLPAALVRDKGAWRAAVGFRRASFDIVKIVTAFTLAHSITLSLAALGLVAVPSRWVESAIAASVAAAALNNLYPVFIERRAVLAFAFGLVHGLGFAAVLLDLGLPANQRWLALVSFNLGVEVGQLAIVGAILPVIYSLSRFRLYSPLILKIGSTCIAGVAFLWLAERSLDLRLTLF